MLPQDDREIETCRSILSVLMRILDFLNYIYIYIQWRTQKFCSGGGGVSINSVETRGQRER